MVRATLWPSDSSSSLVSDAAAAIEEPFAKNQIFYSQWGSASGGNVMRSYISTAKLYGDTQQQVHNGHLYGAAMAADPSNIWYWNCMITPVDSGAALSTEIHVEFQVIYYTELSNLKQLAST